jgi:hypothetical protein
MILTTRKRWKVFLALLLSFRGLLFIHSLILNFYALAQTSYRDYPIQFFSSIVQGGIFLVFVLFGILSYRYGYLKTGTKMLNFSLFLYELQFAFFLFGIVSGSLTFSRAPTLLETIIAALPSLLTFLSNLAAGFLFYYTLRLRDANKFEPDNKISST